MGIPGFQTMAQVIVLFTMIFGIFGECLVAFLGALISVYMRLGFRVWGYSRMFGA